jgi:hypothetical protein
MAKQTFTTGQVLTAAQMTSLQQTAMGGGSTTAKTADYVLVAADAGTTVAMDAATATTITVDTGLFAAGDTVFIQNIGAGDCTITAGTATVDTAGSLILPQYDAGILYFTSASAAIFYDYIQVGAASPLTTKGDLYTYGTSDTRLGVGADGTTLVADSAETTGLKWAAPGGASFVGCALKVSGAQTLTSGTETTVNFDQEDFDTDGFHDNVTNNARITIPAGKGGKYLIYAKITFDEQSGSLGARQLNIKKNTTNFFANALDGPAYPTGGGAFDKTVQISQIMDLVATDFVTITIKQTTGNTTATNYGFSDRDNVFTATYLGA